MMNMNSTVVRVPEYLANSLYQFYIPPFQREYCHKLHILNGFIEDACHNASFIRDGHSGRAQHFIGSLVLQSDKKSSYVLHVIDAQQRLTDISMMVLAISLFVDPDGDLFVGTSDKTDAECRALSNYIREHWLFFTDNCGVRNPRLLHHMHDRKAWLALINGEASLDSEFESTKIMVNFRFVVDTMRRNMELYGITPFDVYNAICEFCSPEPFLLGADDDAQAIYERMNRNNDTLDQYQLIKMSLLCGSAYDEQERRHDVFWDIIEENVGLDNMNSFFYHLSIARNESDQRHGLYSHKIENFKRICIENVDHAFSLIFDDALCSDEGRLNLLSDIKNVSFFYKRILDARDAANSLNADERLLFDIFWCGTKNKVSESAIIVLRLMELLDQGIIKQNQYEDALEMIRNIVFLSALAGRFMCDFNKTRAASIVRDVNDALRVNGLMGVDTDTDEFKKRIKNFDFSTVFADILCRGTGPYKIPSEHDLIREISLNCCYKDSINPVIARVLYNVDKNITRELVPYKHGIKPDELSLDHVHPKTPNDEDWVELLAAGFDESSWENNKHRLGNLTLTMSNSQMQNMPYSQKRKTSYYKQSAFPSTRELSKHSVFTLDDIEKRSRELACAIVECHPLPQPIERDDIDGAYHLLSDSADFRDGGRPVALFFNGEFYRVRDWHEFLILATDLIASVVDEHTIKCYVQEHQDKYASGNFKKNVSLAFDESILLTKSDRAFNGLCYAAFPSSGKKTLYRVNSIAKHLGAMVGVDISAMFAYTLESDIETDATPIDITSIVAEELSDLESSTIQSNVGERDLSKIPANISFRCGKQKNGIWDATMRVEDGKCVVEAGSILGPVKSFGKHYTGAVEKLRADAAIEKKLVGGKHRNVLVEDLVIGDKPSAASSFVIGGCSNGWDRWVDEDGKTLGEYALS